MTVVLEHENVYRQGHPQPDLVDITIIANFRQQTTRIGPAPLEVDASKVPAFAKLGIDWTPHAPPAQAMAAEDIHELL